MGKPGWVVKGAGRLSRRKRGCPPGWLCNSTTRDCIFSLDTTRALAQNPGNFSGSLRNHAPEKAVVNPGGTSVQYLPGWTVQCINPECPARGHWLRAAVSGAELCSNCGAPLHNVPPPLGPRLRLRPRSLGSYRPPRGPR